VNFNISAKKIVTGIDISGEWVRIIEVEHFSTQKVIKRFIVKKIPRTTEDEATKTSQDKQISDILKELIKENNIDTRYCITFIPRYAATVRFLKLPSTEESEIEGMINIQAARQLPFPKEEIITDFRMIASDEKGFSDLLLVMVHQDVVTRHLEILKNADLIPEAVRISSETLWHWFMQVGKKQKLSLRNETIVLLNIDSLSCEIGIFEAASLVMSRSISVGPHRPLENWQRDLKEEVLRTLTAYEKQHDTDTSTTKIFLTGANAFLNSLKDVFLKELSRPVEILAPLQNLSVSQRAQTDSNSLKSSEFSLSFALGCALDDNLSIDLLPKAIKDKKAIADLRLKFIRTAVLSGLVLTFLLISLFSSFYYRKLELGSLKDSLKKVAPVAKRIEKMQERVKLIEHRLGPEGTCLEILAELYKIVPPEISLGKFSFEEGKSVTLRGASKTMSDVFKFVTILEKSAHFQKVKLRYANKRRVEAEEITDFQINCPLTK